MKHNLCLFIICLLLASCHTQTVNFPIFDSEHQKISSTIDEYVFNKSIDKNIVNKIYQFADGSDAENFVFLLEQKSDTVYFSTINYNLCSLLEEVAVANSELGVIAYRQSDDIGNNKQLFFVKDKANTIDFVEKTRRKYKFESCYVKLPHNMWVINDNRMDFINGFCVDDSIHMKFDIQKESRLWLEKN